MIDIPQLQQLENDCTSYLTTCIQTYPENTAVYLSMVQLISSVRNAKDTLAVAKAQTENPTLPFQ